MNGFNGKFWHVKCSRQFCTLKIFTYFDTEQGEKMKKYTGMVPEMLNCIKDIY